MGDDNRVTALWDTNEYTIMSIDDIATGLLVHGSHEFYNTAGSKP